VLCQLVVFAYFQPAPFVCGFFIMLALGRIG
jgi:hypothetical protein